MSSTQRKLRGFSTIELLIAFMILSTTLAAVTLVAIGIPRALENGRREMEALHQADTLLREELALGTESSSAISTGSAFSQVVSIATSSIDGYESGLEVTLLPDGITKRLVSTARWLDGLGIAHVVALTAFVTDFQDISTNGSCDPVLIGDWLHPQRSTFTMSSVNVTGLLPSSLPAHAYPLKALALGTSTLAAAVGSSTSPTDPTIFLFSLASSTHPTYLGSIDTATSSLAGVNAIVMNGSIIYAANAVPADFSECNERTLGPLCSQLQIIDTSNPSEPVILSNFELATSSGPYASGSGGQAVGRALFYANGLLYVGLQKTATVQSQYTSSTSSTGDEFNIINVQNPRAPVWLGEYSVGRTVNQIRVLNGFAYLATDDPSRELLVLNVQDPAHPTLAGSYDAPGSSIYGYGEALGVSSSTILLGRSYTYNGPGLTLLSNSAAVLTQNSSYGATGSTTESSSVVGIILQSFLAFVLTTSAFELWNVSDPAHPSAYTSSIPLTSALDSAEASSSIPTTAGVNGFACRHSTLYVASSDASHNGYLTIFTGS